MGIYNNTAFSTFFVKNKTKKHTSSYNLCKQHNTNNTWHENTMTPYYPSLGYTPVLQILLYGKFYFGIVI